jgi:DNA-binding NarL/FixJ family response regulator
MSVSGTVKTIDEALAALRNHKSDVVVLDACLGAESGVERLREICEEAVAPVVILTGVADPQLHERALCNGAAAVVLKDGPAPVLLDLIERLYIDSLPTGEAT